MKFYAVTVQLPHFSRPVKISAYAVDEETAVLVVLNSCYPPHREKIEVISVEEVAQ